MQKQEQSSSLREWCLDTLVLSPGYFQPYLGDLPTSIHMMLLTRAVILASKSKANGSLREAIILLVSHWPQPKFTVSNLVPAAKLKAEENHTLSPLSMLMEGFLSLKASSKLSVIDFCGSPLPVVFQLPLLSLPQEERQSERILQLMQPGSGIFGDTPHEDPGYRNLETVLTWKLDELAGKMGHYSFEAQRSIEVLTECEIDLSDWVSMHGEVIGLVLKDRTPFQMKITKLTVNNFHITQFRHLHWILSMLDAQVLKKLVIYGKRKSVNLVMWHLRDILKMLTELTTFGLGTVGPKMRLLTEDDPSYEELLQNSLDVLTCWPNLIGVYFLGLMLSREVRLWFEVLATPLQRIVLYGCGVHAEDLEYLSRSHHAGAVRELGLEHNNLRGLGYLICDVINKAPNLEMLNLKETKLQLHEKLSILCSLQACRNINTLVLYENEDILSCHGYKEVVELACALTPLKTFYLFPFNYRPFEIFYRESVEQACQAILMMNSRTDLNLYY